MDSGDSVQLERWGGLQAEISLSLSLIYLKLGEFQRWPSAYPTVAPWIPTAALARVVGLFTGWFTRVRRK